MIVIFGSIVLYGQEKGNIEVIRTLAERGLDPLFLIHRKFGHQHIGPELDRQGFAHVGAPYGPLVGRGLQLIEKLRLIRGLVVTSWALFRACRKFKPDVLYVMNPLYAFYALPALMLLRTPLIYRMGDEPALHNSLYCRLWEYLCRRIKVLVVNCDFLRDAALKAGFRSGQIRRIYSVAAKTDFVAMTSVDDAITLVRRTADGSVANLTLAREPSLLTVLYIGQIAEHKGVHLAVEASIRLLQVGSRLRLLIAGEAGNDYGRALFQRVEDLGLKASILFLGFTSNTDDLWRLVDLHVLPSIWEEPLANAVVEAKANGVPSIIFNRGGTKELVEDGVDGRICREETVDTLANAIDEYLQDGKRLRTHGLAAKKSAETKFSREQFCSQWESALEDALG